MGTSSALLNFFDPALSNKEKDLITSTKSNKPTSTNQPTNQPTAQSPPQPENSLPQRLCRHSAREAKFAKRISEGVALKSGSSMGTTESTWQKIRWLEMDGIEMWLQFGGMVGCFFVGGFWGVDFNPVWDGLVSVWVAFFHVSRNMMPKRFQRKKRLNFNRSVGITLQWLPCLWQAIHLLKEGPQLPTTTIPTDLPPTPRQKNTPDNNSSFTQKFCGGHIHIP